MTAAVTPLEALQRLIGAASMIDANECKDEVIYNVLQGELAVACRVAKELAAAPVVPVAAQPVVPEGWKLVPEEPTLEMFNASAKIDNEMFAGGSSHGADDGQVWAAMYDAAPAAPHIEAQPAGEVVRDAARYRYLRGAKDDLPIELVIKVEEGGAIMDAAIDAAMAQGDKHE